MKCKHGNVNYLWWHDGTWLAFGLMRPHDARICIECNEWLALGPSNDKDCEIEIAAARLFAGYVTANDTDDILADPIAKPLLDWQLDEHGPMTIAMADCNALYGAMSDDYHAEHDDLLSRCIAETETDHA